MGRNLAAVKSVLTLRDLTCLKSHRSSWRNTDNDILQSGDSTLCIDFQPGLSSEARDQLVEQYYGKIVSETDLPFRNFAKRWTRAMSKCKLETTQSLIVEGSSAESVGKDISRMLSDKTAMTDVYVPPYLLPLSEEFIKLDDHTADGSQTKLIVEEDSLKIQQYLHSNSGGAQFEVRLPATVLNFCASLDPELDVDELLRQRKGDKLPYLLSTFGWSVDHVTSAEDDGIIVKCNVCNARARLAKAVSSQPQWKRRKADSDAHLRLIESHRVHCPYACGFSFGPGRKTELTGWQKVITCLIKS